jgi:hypothetical protein
MHALVQFVIAIGCSAMFDQISAHFARAVSALRINADAWSIRAGVAILSLTFAAVVVLVAPASIVIATILTGAIVAREANDVWRLRRAHALRRK